MQADKEKPAATTAATFASLSDHQIAWPVEHERMQQQQLDTLRKSSVLMMEEHESVQQTLNEALSKSMTKNEQLAKDAARLTSQHNVVIVENSQLKDLVADQKSQIAQLMQQLSEAIPLVDHKAIVKNFERALSKTVAENLEMKDMVSGFCFFHLYARRKLILIFFFKKNVFTDQINCLQVNMVATGELLKKAEAEIAVFKAQKADTVDNKSAIETLQSQVHLLQAQVRATIQSAFKELAQSLSNSLV